MKSTQPKPNSFLWPLLELPWTTAVDSGFIRLYTGNREYEGKAEWGNYLYALFNAKSLKKDFLERLMKHKLYIDYYYPDENHAMFVFDIPPVIKQTVIQPFLEGKYSKIDRAYIRSYFRKYTPSGQPSINWRILHKDPLLRQEWELVLGQSLPENAEVWARPEMEEDIYKYVESN